MTTPSSPDLGADARSLLEAVTAISSDLDLATVLTRLVEAATSLTNAGHGALGVLGAHGVLVEFITTDVDPRTRDLVRDLPHDREILGTIVEDPSGLWLVESSSAPASGDATPDAARDDVPNAVPDEIPDDATSILGVPVRIRGTVFGTLYLTDKAGAGPFTAADERLVEELAASRGA